MCITKTNKCLVFSKLGQIFFLILIKAKKIIYRNIASHASYPRIGLVLALPQIKMVYYCVRISEEIMVKMVALL